MAVIDILAGLSGIFVSLIFITLATVDSKMDNQDRF